MCAAALLALRAVFVLAAQMNRGLAWSPDHGNIWYTDDLTVRHDVIQSSLLFRQSSTLL